MSRKFLFLLSIFVFFSFQVLPQQKERSQKLGAENSSWTSVISGKALCALKKTSYGFAVLTDGKMISACTEKGVKLWEKGIPGRPDPYLTVFSSDFLLAVSDKRNLSLINPSGLTLWTVKVPFEILEEPFSGRDSRIIVRGKNKIACYGVNGICKWILETPSLGGSKLLELNDGTILALLSALKNGKSAGIRFSPFGSIVEEIVFSGEIQSAESCPDGILLSFNGGGAGMCSVSNGKTSTKWTIPYSDRAFSNTNPSGGAKFIALPGHRAALAVCGSGSVKTRFLVFSTFDGRVSDWFNTDCAFSGSFFTAATNDGGIFSCDKTKGFVQSTNGDILWSGILPEKPDIFSSWNFISFTKENYLVICSNSWAMAGFRTTYKIQKKNTEKTKKPTYIDFYKTGQNNLGAIEFSERIPEYYAGEARKKILQKGGYGEKETEYAAAMISLCGDYSKKLIQISRNARSEQKIIYQRDSAGMQDFFSQLELFGTDTFVPYLASFIKLEQDDTNFQTLLRSVSEFGYDPEGLILAAIDIRAHNIPASKSRNFILVCDAVLEICRFMGRPALYSCGMDILTEFLYPQYESSVRDYARNTLAKIAVLKI